MSKAIYRISITKERTQRAYCAGLIDGEGWIGLSRYYTQKNKKLSYVPQMTIAMTDRRPLEQLERTLGGHVIEHRIKLKSGKTKYSWTMTRRQMIKVLKLVMPYLYSKKEVAKLTLEYAQKVQKRAGMWKNGNIILTTKEIEKRTALFEQIQKLNNLS